MKFSDYLSQAKAAINGIKEDDINKIADILIKARDNNQGIYVFGNGDSASNATHLVADLAKGTVERSRKRFRIISLNQNVPLMTAWGNDISYDMIFKEQLENFVENGDIVIGISTSGNSPNVLRAIEFANGKGAITIGLTASKGGKLAEIARHSVIAKTENVEIAEDVHWIVGHLLKIRIMELNTKER